MAKKHNTNSLQKTLRQELTKLSRNFKKDHNLYFPVKGRRIRQMGDSMISFAKILDIMYKTDKEYSSEDKRRMSKIIDRDLALLASIHNVLGEDYAKKHMFNRANFLDHITEQVSLMVEPVTVVVDLNQKTTGKGRDTDHHIKQINSFIIEANAIMKKFGINGTYTHEIEEDRNGLYSTHMHAFMDKSTYKQMQKATKDPKSPLYGCEVVMKNLFNGSKANVRRFTNYITKSLVNSKMFGNEGGKRKIEARASIKILTHLSPYLYSHVPNVDGKWGNRVISACNLVLADTIFHDFASFLKNEFRKASKTGASALFDTADRITKKALDTARILLAIGHRMTT